MGRPRYSCALPPGLDVVERAQLAERLGYHRVWVFESPAVYGDTWIALARIAQATGRIGLATGVAIPGLRHPMVTASAIASVAELAPGRLAVAWGTGYTGRSTLGRKPVRWAELTSYVRRVRGLLDGEIVEIDGRECQMMHLPGFAPERPLDVPFWIAASGPAGAAAAKDLGAAGLVVTSTAGAPAGWDEVALLRFGTVLDPGEDHRSPRVVEAAGPGYASTVHALWEYAGESVDTVPGGARWRAALVAERPEGQRHLVAHQGHLSSLTERDRDLVIAGGTAVLEPGWTGDAASLKKRFDEADVTEVIYTPAGPDVQRELTAFAAAVSR